MKNLFILLFAFSMLQVTGQDKSAISENTRAISDSAIERLAEDQLKNLTEKLSLNPAQQQVASNMVLSQLKTEKFQKLLGSIGANNLVVADESNKINEKVQNALFLDKDFKKSMGFILDAKQRQSMEDQTPK
jgi:hypothetical protein